MVAYTQISLLTSIHNPPFYVDPSIGVSLSPCKYPDANMSPKVDFQSFSY